MRKTYSWSEAFQVSREYFCGDELATDAYLTKYALRNSDNELVECSPVQSLERVVGEFCRIESTYPNSLSRETISFLFNGFRYVVVQGSPLAALGDSYHVQSLSNCFTLPPPHDSYAGIMHTDQQEAQIMKRRGGVGFDISALRPKGMKTANAARTTDGIGLFMQRYSNTCREVAQGGRRGALSMICDVTHPQIEDFITIKKDLQLVTGANCSIKFTDEFMESVEKDGEFTLRWPTSAPPKFSMTVRAREVWDKFVDAAWSCGEPGALFWDTILRMTPSEVYRSKGQGTVGINPCGELILPEFGSCILMALNSAAYVTGRFTERSEFDWKTFSEHVRLAQRLIDDLVDLEHEKIDQIISKVESDEEPEHVKAIELDMWKKVRETLVLSRRTGLGMSAVGDTIAMLGMTYGSPESIEFVEKLYKTFSVNAHASSIELAKERGAFPLWKNGADVGNQFMDRLKNSMIDVLGDEGRVLNEQYEKTGRRNIALTTQAPVGSLSMLMRAQLEDRPGLTSGIESVLKLRGKRRRKLQDGEESVVADFVDKSRDRWKEYDFVHPGLRVWMEVTGDDDEKRSPYWGSTANDIDWSGAVQLQSAAQRHIEHSISRTCNLPRDATRELVSEVYMRAWKSGCKGITVYRDGSRDGVIVDSDSVIASSDQPTSIVDSHAPKRPRVLDCDVHKCNVKGESWTILVGLLNGRPYEVFGGLSKYVEIPKKVKSGRVVKVGKKSGSATYSLEWGDGDDVVVVKDVVSAFENPIYGEFTRTLSLSLRHGIPIQYVCEQLTRGKSPDMSSFSRVMARVLKNYIPDGVVASVEEKSCPSCGSSKLIYSGGCVSCDSCVWSRC